MTARQPMPPSPPAARSHSRSRRIATFAAALAALAIAATGCVTADVQHTSSATTDPAAACGPSTAAIDADTIEPIASDPAPTLPVTVRSADGVDVTVTDISRILAVNLYGSLAEIVFSLGLGDHVVGRDISTTFTAAQHLPLVTGGGHDLAAESVLALNPTVVLVDSSIGPPEVISQLRASGIPVVFVDDQQTLPGIADHIRAVAAALGVPGAGEKLVERVDTQIADARAAASATSVPLTVAFLYVRGTAGVYLMGGKGSGADAMIEAIGGTDAGTVAGLKGFRPITSEALINSAPDVIVVMTKGLESVGGVSALLKIPGIAQTPAGQHRRIVDVDDGALLNFGARTGATIAALAEAVYHPCDAASRP